MSTRILLPCLAAIAIATAAACSSESDAPLPTPPVDVACTSSGLTPGPAPIRRLTHFEYDNTVRDLLGDTTHPGDAFGAEEEALGFNNNAAALVTSSTLVEKYMLAAEGISERATADMDALLPCAPAEVGESACADQFIDTFGARAFRRPLEDGERSMLRALYDDGRATDFRTGIEMVIEGALQSPRFLYRVEFGTGEALAEGNVVRLDDWEMASRLSYFLWGTMPDEELFSLAAAGSLSTPEQVETQARRMLNDTRAREAVAEFHKQWLDYDRIKNVGKDAYLFPTWSATIGELMREETERFIDYAVWDGGDLATLLTSSSTYLNEELASFYGVNGVDGDAFQLVELDPAQRAGILSSGSLMSIYAHSNITSPVHRGQLVRERFLCHILPLPPPGVDITAPEPDPNATPKEQFSQHSEDPECSGCHQMMDPIGFGFENFDAVGRFRTEVNGVPVDATGEVVGGDAAGKFEGVRELTEQLADTGVASACYAQQWFRYAYGRAETEVDDCTMEKLQVAFEQNEGNIRELLVSLTQTDAFLYRPTVAAGNQGGQP